MVRDGGNAGLGNHLGHGQAERNMHRNGENILRDEHLEIETFDKLVDRFLQLLSSHECGL